MLPNVPSGRPARVDGATIVGVASCLPSRVVTNGHFEKQFGSGVAEVTKMTGVQSRHWVNEDQTTSDLCARAAEHLLDRIGWSPDSVDALIFISQTPDYRLPATAAVLQARCGLRPGVIAFDVNLGCSAYPYGLWLAMTMVSSGAAGRVLLAVGDTSSRVVDLSDRATAMLFGDAGTVTAIEHSATAEPAFFILGTDGKGAHNLIIPCGGFRAGEARGGNDPAKLFMDGAEIFSFTLKAVPPLIADTLQLAGHTVEDYDAFLLHQANTFMINHLAKKAKLPKERVPVNIDRFGNTSSATLPLLITDSLPDITTRPMRLGLFGFGVGYSWAGASLMVPPLSCADTLVL